MRNLAVISSLVLSTLALGCADRSSTATSPSERLGKAASPIFNGQPDPGHDAVVYVDLGNASCSGTILANCNGTGYVLTAAHCVSPAEVGVGARVVEIANRGSKALGGKLTFMLASLRALARWRDVPVRSRFPLSRLLWAPAVAASYLVDLYTLRSYRKTEFAREILAAGLSTRFSEIAVDNIWTTSVIGYAVLAIDLGDANAAAQLLPLIEPFASEVAFNGVTSQGPIAAYAGKLASLLGQHEAAEQHLLAALDIANAFGWV